MRRIVALLVLSVLVLPSMARAQTDLREPAGGEWLTIGGDWKNSRYSTLTQINRDNVKTLKAAWMINLGSGIGTKYSMEGTPIAIENTNEVRIIDYAFSPSRITVTAGTKVTFTNTGSQAHNAAGADAPGWDTDVLNQGETANVTFNKPGTYSYICTPHPFMIGQVIVTGPEVASAPAVKVEARTQRADEAPDHTRH